MRGEFFFLSLLSPLPCLLFPIAPSRRFGIVRSENPRTDRHSGPELFPGPPGLLGPHASDEHHRTVTGPGGESLNAGQPQRIAGVGLGGGVPHRADPPVVGSCGRCGLRRIPDRGTDHETRRRHPADHLHRGVVLSQVHSGRAARQGHVGPVIHEHRDRHRLPQDRQRREQVLASGTLPPELHRRHTTGHSGYTSCHQIGQITGPLEIGHQKEAERLR